MDTLPYGVSVSPNPDDFRAYVANYGSNTVSVINTATNAVVATVTVGSFPIGVSVSPDGSRVYVANYSSNTVSVINTATNVVVATVAVGRSPIGVSVSPDGSRVYVVSEYLGNVSVINTTTNAVVTTVAVGDYPNGVSVSPDGSRVYVANYYSNNVTVINTTTNAVVATVTVGSFPKPLGNFIKAGATGCTGTPTTFTVTVNPSVTPSVSIAASPSGAITAGTSVTFTATPTNGGTTPTYQWKKGGTNISGETAATYTSTTLANNDAITCVMTPSAEICVSATTATSTGITMTVTSSCDCDPTCSPIPTAAGTYTATRSKVIGLYTHYCSGSNLLLSILTPTNGTVVPFAAVKIKIGATASTYYSRYCGGTSAATACFVTLPGGGVLLNRNWHIDSALVTGAVISFTNPLQIVSYFTDVEYTGLNASLTGNSLTALSSQTGLKLYVPKIGYNFGAFPNPSLNKPMASVSQLSHGTAPSLTVWLRTLPQVGINAAEFKVSTLQNTGGIGKFF